MKIEVIVIAFEKHVAGMLALQLIALVTVYVCGPLPSGASTPGAMLTVNCHVVPLGRITPLSASRMVNVPPGPSKPFTLVPLKETPFNVGVVPPGVTSCAEIVPPAHGIPVGSTIAPLTVVKPPWAAAKVAQNSNSAGKANQRTIPQRNLAARESVL